MNNSGNFSLAHAMLAGMGNRQPTPAPAPAGGLNAMNPAGNPAAMQKQGTDSALAQENQELSSQMLSQSASFGNQQFARQLQGILSAGLPSQTEVQRARAARSLLMQNALEAMAPREYSAMDTAMAGISSYQKPIMYGDEGAAFAAMGAGATNARKQFRDEEQKRALGAYTLVDSEIDQQQKLLTDAMTKQQQLQGTKPEFFLPDGTPVYKSGTRLVTVGKNGKPTEWLGAEKTVIGGDTLYGKRAQMVEMLVKEYLDRGSYNTLEEATTAAEREADRLIGRVSGATGVETRPTTPAAATPSTAPISEVRTPAKAPVSVDANSLEGYEFLRSQIAEASRVGDRQKVTDLQKEMLSQFPNGKPTADQPLPGATKKKDPRLEAGKKEYGGEEGKALFKEREALSTAYQANTALEGQLSLLEELYSNPNLPEGKLGPAMQNIRSGLKSLGVDVGEEVAMGDMANALAQKMVLGIRTADGTNLLPGAISNFEVQMLQSMGPTLGMSSEGRKALVAYMKDVARSQQRLAEEATKFESENSRLTPEWYKRKERIVLEEQARRAINLRKITATLKGAK